MTSKNLFFKLQIEDIRRRIWTIALSMLFFFLILPINSALRLGQDNFNQDKDWRMEQILNILSPHYEMIMIVTIVGAIICGLSSFFYLQSRKKVDFYHSIPVRRETLFAFSYLNGILIYLIPYVMNVILTFVMLTFNRKMSFEVFQTALSGIGYHLLFFCLIYTVVVIAVMLTGNFVISCFGTAALLLYVPVLNEVRVTYFSTFFSNYYRFYQNDYHLLQLLNPIEAYVSTMQKLQVGNYEGIVGRVLSVFLFTVLLILCAVFLYKKRPSEAAGKAMSFGISQGIIKFMLVIPISLFGGMLFRNFTNRSSAGWFIFGLVFALLIAYAVVEIIYNFDIRCAFRYKKQMLSCAGIVAIIACVFWFDLLNYDTYLPKKDKIESMSVAVSGLDENIRYLDQDRYNYRYSHNILYQLKNMELTEFDAAYEMAQYGAKNNALIDFQEKNIEYYIKFTLKSGREIYRKYRMPNAGSYDMIKKVYDNKAFKEAHFPIDILKAEEITDVYGRNKFGMTDFSLSDAKERQLLQLYKEDLYQLSLEDRLNINPLGTIYFDSIYYGVNYYIFPGFDKTIAFLQEHGFDPTRSLEPTDIKEIRLENYQQQVEPYPYKDAIEYSKKYGNYTTSYTDPAQIEAILPNLIDGDYYRDNYSLLDVEHSISITVVIRQDEFGNVNEYTYYMKKGQIPEFVAKDLNYQDN